MAEWASRFSFRPDGATNLITDASLVILTFGVGFDLVDERNEIVINPQNISLMIKEQKWRFTLKTPEEISENIVNCVETIKTTNPMTQVVITHSPIPLSSFVGDHHVFLANTLSKASLSLGISIAKSKIPFIYFPSYELVISLNPIINPNKSLWGADGTTRHPSTETIDAICKAFLTLANFNAPSQDH